MNAARGRRMLRSLLAGGAVACPLAAFVLGRAARPGLAVVALTWAPLAVLGAWSLWRRRRHGWLALLGAAVLLVSWRGRGELRQHLELAYVFEHAGSLSLLGVMFGSTLRRGQQPLVTRFAAAAHPTLSPALLRYTRAVTLAWTLFFAAMACASVLVFATRPLSQWAWFASACTPALVVLMFVAEYAVRRRALPPAERAGPWEAVQAYLRYTLRRRDEADGVSR